MQKGGSLRRGAGRRQGGRRRWLKAEPARERATCGRRADWFPGSCVCDCSKRLVSSPACYTGGHGPRLAHPGHQKGSLQCRVLGQDCGLAGCVDVSAGGHGQELALCWRCGTTADASPLASLPDLGIAGRQPDHSLAQTHGHLKADLFLFCHDTLRAAAAITPVSDATAWKPVTQAPGHPPSCGWL